MAFPKGLCVTRRRNEVIVIGDGETVPYIKIGVADIHRDEHVARVKIVVEAPRGVPVHRQEVFDKIQEESNGTAESKPS